ncbi:hypothetical protein [Microbacterium sp. NPDC055665]
MTNDSLIAFSMNDQTDGAHRRIHCIDGKHYGAGRNNRAGHQHE